MGDYRMGVVMFYWTLSIAFMMLIFMMSFKKIKNYISRLASEDKKDDSVL